ncbi:MAG TPA: PadR family transcriptional regulator, partial [Gemmatimonadales bacterium]
MAAQLDVLRGTLDLLVLKALTFGPLHGYGVARWIERATGEALGIEEGSLYPALHRLDERGWVEANWDISDNNRRARFYRLTAKGRAQLKQETASFTAARCSSAQSADRVPAARLAARQWFRDARFGLFIHWGVYSELGRGEWVMQNEKMPIASYERLPASFNPVKFDAKAWVALAKAAGMRYITITSRHHDGFAMFATKANG